MNSGRIQELLYEKTKNKYIAKFFSPIIYICMLLIYNILKIIFFNSKSRISYSDALKNINKKYKINHVSNNFEDLKKENLFDLSIIVPTYNCEKYIEECISSIVNQNGKYLYEVIIVDDGSQDNTLTILKKFSNISNIRIITKTNGGSASARNRGICESNGKYIMFVDSDDRLSDNAIEYLMTKALNEDADIVLGSYKLFDKYRTYNTTIEENEIITDKYRMLLKKGYPWAKVIKREFFYKVRFPEGFLYEDTIMCYLIYSQCKKMVTISHIVYNYRLNINSTSRSKSLKHNIKNLDSYFVVEDIINYLPKTGIEFDNNIYNFTINVQLSNILYERIKRLDRKIVESTFILACNLVENMNKTEKNYLYDQNSVRINLEKALYTRNFKMWKLCCYMLKIL